MPVRHVRLPAALLALLLVAGCLQAPGVDERAADPAGTDADADPQEHTLYFADGWTLENATPDDGPSKRAPLGDFYGAWAAGGPFPEWASAPLTRALHVTGDVEVDFWVTTDTAVTSTPGIFPDFVLYFGTTDSLLADASPRTIRSTAGQDATVLAPGDVARVTATLTLPPGGLVVPADAGLRVMTAPVMTETDANDLEILYGSRAHASAVHFNATPVHDAPWETGETTGETSSHTLTAGSLVAGEAEGTTTLELPVDVPPDASALRVDLAFTGRTPFPDMDLYLLGPDGEAFARSVTPGPHESVHLYAPNLAEGGTGTWTVKVVNYVTVQATFDVTATLVAPSA